MLDSAYWETDPFERLCSRMNAALASAKTALLTEDQHDDLLALGEQVEQLCKSGRLEDATRVAKLAKKLIDAGPPAVE